MFVLIIYIDILKLVKKCEVVILPLLLGICRFFTQVTVELWFVNSQTNSSASAFSCFEYIPSTSCLGITLHSLGNRARNRKTASDCKYLSTITRKNLTGNRDFTPLIIGDI